MMYTHKALMFAVLMASISVAQAGPATSAAQLREERVPYSDVNIGSKAGNAVMLGRIRAASHEVCASKPSLRDAQA
jgi:UrcA family protein